MFIIKDYVRPSGRLDGGLTVCPGLGFLAHPGCTLRHLDESVKCISQNKLHNVIEMQSFCGMSPTLSWTHDIIPQKGGYNM
jgi:hypothetical protein